MAPDLDPDEELIFQTEEGHKRKEGSDGQPIQVVLPPNRKFNNHKKIEIYEVIKTFVKQHLITANDQKQN